MCTCGPFMFPFTPRVIWIFSYRFVPSIVFWWPHTVPPSHLPTAIHVLFGPVTRGILPLAYEPPALTPVLSTRVEAVRLFIAVLGTLFPLVCSFPFLFFFYFYPLYHADDIRPQPALQCDQTKSFKHRQKWIVMVLIVLVHCLSPAKSITTVILQVSFYFYACLI